MNYYYPMHVNKPGLPVLNLNGNVIEYIHQIKSVNLREAVNNGLKPFVNIEEIVAGQYITAHCCNNGQVYLSPTFAQALWCMSYLAVSLCDKSIVEKEFNAKGVAVSRAYDDIIHHEIKYAETEYIRSLVEAKELSDIFQLVCRFTKHNHTHADIKC